MNDDVEHKSLKDAVCEDASESQKLLGVGSDDTEDEVRMLEHRPHVREGTASGPPLALIKRVKLLGLRFRDRIQDGMLNRLFHGGLGIIQPQCRNTRPGSSRAQPEYAGNIR